MAESRRTSRLRYLGPTGGILVVLAVLLALLTSPAPVRSGPQTSIRSQDVGARTSASALTPSKAGPSHAPGTSPHGPASRASTTSLIRSAHGGPTPLSTTTTTSSAGRPGAKSIGTGTGLGAGTSTTTTGSTGSDPAAPCSDSTPPVAAPSGSWQCTFDDEFNGDALDTSKWQPQLSSTSGYTTGAAPDLVCYVDNPDTISESGGTLNLSVVQTPTPQACGQGETQFEGGMVSSYQIFTQRYGFFEARAKLPASTLLGLQETLWLYPEDQTLFGPFPDSGEIDYGEFYSEFPTTDVPVVHFPGSQDDPNATNDYCSIAGTATAGQFNTYALLWTPTTITAYFNGMPCITDTYAPYVQSPDAAPGPFNQPFFMAFTSALGYGSDSPVGQDMSQELPATTSLDWMRVWQYG
jgi:beta-glucanase (GH16 family)